MAPSPILDPVATTSRITAAMRAAESERPDRLFADPFAAALAGDRGRDLARRISAGDTIPVRTRYLDDHVREALRAGARQLVLPAAGMDTRAWRLALPDGVTVFEVDRPELLALKAHLLDGARTRADRITVGADLTAGWVPALLADFVGAELLRSPAAEPMLAAMRAQGSPWLFATDDPTALFTDRGWDPAVSGFGDVTVALGRTSGFGPVSDGLGHLVHATR